ncbi:hypothetical protein M3J09_002788 [Ascochyta lentis]
MAKPSIALQLPLPSYAENHGRGPSRVLQTARSQLRS